MRACTTAIQLAIAAILAGAGTAVSAQSTYLCSAEGRSWQSAQPCAGRPASSLRAVGPERERRTSTLTESKTVAKAQEHLQYQSPLCAEMSEGIRNGPGRGLGRSAQQELHESYRRLCSEDESRARNRLQDDRLRQREARERDEKAAKLEQDRVKLSREQCDEMYRIAHGRRQRLETMTPGERSDFERFETTRKSRCAA